MIPVFHDFISSVVLSTYPDIGNDIGSVRALKLGKIVDNSRAQMPASVTFSACAQKILLDKLYHYGIKGTALCWFKDYLTNRQQYVDIDDTASGKLVITTGVLQGSILGPLCFLSIKMTYHTRVSYSNSFFMLMTQPYFHPLNILYRHILPILNNELIYIRDWLIINKFHQPRLVIRTFHRQGRCSRGGHLCNEHSEEKYSCSYK